MPYRLHISEEEVREELRRLGHEDVPPQLVASFRKDLLKLIKGDIKRLKEKKNSQLSESAASTAFSVTSSTTLHSASCSTDSPSRSNDSSSGVTSSSDAVDSVPFRRGAGSRHLERAHSQPSVRAASYSASFESSIQDGTNTSIASSALGLQRQIDRRARRARHRDSEAAAVVPNAGESDSESGYSDRDDSQASSHTVHRSSSRASTSSGVSSATASTHSSEPSVAVERRSRPQTSQAADRVKRAPSLPSYPARTDPVSLYHYYKAHWDQRPPPGEDPRSSLRWRVRAQLFYSK